MDKKLLNEDIQNIKYLFGYKPGKVISEQDIDYTTDAYLDITDTELDEYFHNDTEDFDLSKHSSKRYPERLVKHRDTGKIVGTHRRGEGFRPSPHGEELGFEYHSTDIPSETEFGGVEVGDLDYSENLFEQETDRYMFFSNLEQIHRQTGLLLEKDPDMINDILENGHDWAQDHIATAKESIDQVFDFLINEENGQSDESNMVMNEDLEFNDEEETTESILEKHNLLDEVHLFKDDSIFFRDQSSEVIQRFLDILPEFTELQFLSIANCDYVDFSDIDVCSSPNLVFINLGGTPNNLEEQDYECITQETPDFFFIK